MKYREEIYLEENGEKIYGEKLPVIVNNNGYYLSYIAVFKNGLIHCNCEFINLDQLKNNINSGRLLQNIPDNETLQDRVYDILDIVTGWCSLKTRVWK